MRKSFWIVIVLVTVFTLFSIADTIHLTMDVGDSTAGRLLQNSVKIYEQTHPNVKIDVVVLPYYGGFMQKLALSIAGGTEPDLVQITTAYIPQTAPYMINLAPYIQKALNMNAEEYKDTVIPSM
ncbi:MAG: extracellular solute-binding protein, partial [Athalassotoga sp.]|uniref:extracellular solute-binding protein n=1 Tax=Athalassotoga sp. TaxID=2022597 RepID=UPI003D04F02C